MRGHVEDIRTDSFPPRSANQTRPFRELKEQKFLPIARPCSGWWFVLVVVEHDHLGRASTRRSGPGRGEVDQYVRMGPSGCLLLWIVVFPVYLYIAGGRPREAS